MLWDSFYDTKTTSVFTRCDTRLSLVKYPKLLLGYHLGLGSFYTMFINTRYVYYFH
jgi:hypothetical protein